METDQGSMDEITTSSGASIATEGTPPHSVSTDPGERWSRTTTSAIDDSLRDPGDVLDPICSFAHLLICSHTLISLFLSFLSFHSFQPPLFRDRRTDVLVLASD